MGRGGKGKKKAVSAAAGLAPPQQRPTGGDKKKSAKKSPDGISVDKKIPPSTNQFSFVDPTITYKRDGIFLCFKPIRWIEIDPHCPASNCFHVDDNPVLNSPPSGMDLPKLLSYGTVVSDSKAYFIGGDYQRMALMKYSRDFVYDDDVDDDDYDDFFSDLADAEKIVYSPKMFVRDLSTRDWNELAGLNVARSNPTVVVVGAGAEKVIYVFGGFTDSGYKNDGRRNTLFTDKKHWIECFNLADYNNKKDAKWEFLGPDSFPPEALFKDDNPPVYHFVYEPGNQIVFFMRHAGFYSFNYISKKWAPFRSKLCECEEALVKCYKVVVIDHLLFWHYLGFMYAYDLKNNALVLEQRLDQVKVSFATPEPCYFFYPEATFIERIGKDTLILVVRDSHSMERETGLHLYKFQIQYLTPKTRSDHSFLRLLQIGSGVFPWPGNDIINVLAI